MALRVYPLSLLRGKPFPPRAGLRLAILQGVSLVSRLEDRGETEGRRGSGELGRKRRPASEEGTGGPGEAGWWVRGDRCVRGGV